MIDVSHDYSYDWLRESERSPISDFDKQQQNYVGDIRCSDWLRHSFRGFFGGRFWPANKRFAQPRHLQRLVRS